MSWFDAIALAYTGVRRRVGRAVLTVLAVALAAALLTALLTIAGTARTRVIDQLARGGPLAGISVVAAEPDPRGRAEDNPDPGPAKVLDEAALQQIEDLPEVRSVIPVVTSRVFTLGPASLPGRPAVPTPLLVRAFGVDLGEPARLPVTVTAGRLPAPDSTDEVAVTDAWVERYGLALDESAEAVGTELTVAVGRATEAPTGELDFRGGAPASYELREMTWTVVGVVAQDVADGSFLVPLGVAEDNWDYVNSGVGFGLDQRQSLSPYSGALVAADSLDAVTRVRDRITAVGYANTSPANLIEAVRRYLRVVEIVLGSIGGIALAVAGLGIANALLAAVRERRREIGVLKAIGARDRDVRRVFLVEAGVLGLAGGVLGAAIGYACAFGVGLVVDRYLEAQGLAPVGAEVPVLVLLGVTAGSALLALLGGTLPAMRAARLPAREAVGGS